MAYGGTGLPSPDSGNVLTQAPNVVDAERFTNAQAWGHIAQVGEKIATAGATAMRDAEHQRQVGYLADRENAVNDWTVENRAKSAFKPDEFKSNAEAFRDGTIANAEPWAVPHLSRYINQHTNSAYAGILHEKLAQDKHLSSEALTTNILTSENDLVGAAMGGLPIATHAMALRARLDAAVTAGFHPKEWADARFEMTLSKAADETAARSAVEIYHKAGYEPAVDHLRTNILENNELSLKPEQKQAAFRRGMEAIRLEKQIDLQQRGALNIEAHDMKSKIDAGVPVDEGAFRDLQSALARSGAASAHRSLTVAWEVKQQTRGMSVDQLAQSTNVARANAIVSVSTPGGAKVNVSQQAAPAFVGFLTDLEAAGAPVKDVGGYNPRNIAGTNTPSQHSYGNAIDIDQTGRNESGIKAWGIANADKLAAIEAKWGMKGGQNFSNPDWGHWEWTGAGAAPSQPTSPYHGDIAKGVQAAFVAQARKDLPNYKEAIERGAYLDHDSMAAVRYAGKVSGDAHWEREVENLAIANEVGLRTQDLPIEQRQAARDSVMAELKTSGLSPVDQNYINDIVKRTAALRDKQVRDDPVGYSIDQGWGTPTPLDLSTLDKARYGLQERILRVRGVAEHERTPVGIPLRQSERDAYANAISNGKPEQAGIAMGALATVPDDMIGKVLGSEEIKTALTGAIHSADPARYSQAMTFMSSMWKRQPDLTAHVFGGDAVAELKNWETNGRYMTPEQLADDRKRKVLDPQAVEFQKTQIEAARTQLKPIKFEDVVAKFDTSHWFTPGPIARATGSQPLPPTPTDPTKPLPAMSQGERNAFMGDFETQAAKLMAGGMKKDDAVKQAVEMMKTVWKPSALNGNRLMRDAPEFAAAPSGELYNPEIDGSRDWMKKQLEDTIAKETGKPVETITERAAYRAARDAARDAGTSTPQGVRGGSNYQLVPDDRTKAEIQRGVSPSYNVVVQDKTSQKWEVMKWRMQFSADDARAQSYGMSQEATDRRNRVTAVDDALRAIDARGGAGRELIRQADRAGQ